MASHFAHSENRAGIKHLLVDHLRAVAETARGLAAKFDAGELGYWAGWWHDLGKFHPNFTRYLQTPERLRGPDHSSAGIVHAAGKNELLPFIIGGHHGGLDSRANLKDRLKAKYGDSAVQQALHIAADHLPAEDGFLESRLPRFLRDFVADQTRETKGQLQRATEFFIRMLFSALVDADFLDTESHFYPELAAKRTVAFSLADLWARFEQDQAQLVERARGRLNRIRYEIYQKSQEATNQRQGFFRLTAPTGAGKTRSALGFALAHALHHGLDRVAVAMPYTSIIEQTADVYREILGDEDGVVLEHHSAAAFEETTSDPVTTEHTWSRLASQNWDAPVIVTTTVQLFESLFANRPGQCRKLHNLARSVIILDEVQTLPPGLLEPILDVLRQLVTNYRATVVLSTATQPALENSPYLHGLEDVQEVLPDPSRYFQELRRVRYEVPAAKEPWTWQQVADRLRTEPQALAIVNTKKDAMALLEALDDPSAMHLSTLLCGAHRRAVLQEVRRRLKEGKCCRLISTQVVEAGVDLDFPVLLRAVGPLDRIIQAAGRCNREGRLDVGHMVVFDPVAGGVPPGAYRTGFDLATAMLKRGFDLDDPQTYHRYFEQLFQAVELDARRIQPARERLDFPEVAQEFRLIPDDSVSVVVSPPAHQDRVEELLDHVRRQANAPYRLVQQLQPYVVNIHSCLLPQYQRHGLVEQVAGRLWRWLGGYDPVRGLVVKGPDPESLVV